MLRLSLSLSLSLVLGLAACASAKTPEPTTVQAPAPTPAQTPASSALELPALFSDHLVLQREARAPLWGRAASGARVELTASWDSKTVATTAGAGGRWRAELQTPAAGGPFEIRVSSGGATRVLHDVLVGEVWLASGQSNMEWTLGPGVGNGVEGWEEAVRDSRDPALRFFAVENALASGPQSDVHASWIAADPEHSGAFSATAYFFARKLRRELGVPIAVLEADWGGTPAEAWTRAEALAPFPEFAPRLARLKECAQDPERCAALLREERERYFAALAPAPPADAPASDGAMWTDVVLPTSFEQHGLASFDGLVYYRRALELPAAFAGRALVLELGAIDDRDSVYWNGAHIGGHEEDGQWQTPRRYVIPGASVRAGVSELAVRVLDTGGLGGFMSPAETLRAYPENAPGEALPLGGPWQWRAGKPLAEIGLPPPDQDLAPNDPSVLWNAMIAPLVPSALRGVIWYQGEANCGTAARYRELFPALIRDWRFTFGAEIPFLFVQIAPFAYSGDTGEAAMLRDAQRRTLALAHTGMAVTMDIGNPTDIHPLKKREVGERLALWALAGTYGRPELECSGPLYSSMTVEGGAIRLAFTHATGLSSHGEPVRHLALAGADHVFHPAEGRIDGATLVVSSPEVSAPVAVRFGFGAADQTNLWNAAELPAASFRTDDW